MLLLELDIAVNKEVEMILTIFNRLNLYYSAKIGNGDVYMPTFHLRSSTNRKKLSL